MSYDLHTYMKIINKIIDVPITGWAGLALAPSASIGYIKNDKKKKIVE